MQLHSIGISSHKATSAIEKILAGSGGRCPAKLLFPFLLAALAACSAGPAVAPAEAGRTAHFTILQINDTYKIGGLENGSRGGFARLRTLRKQLEAEGRKVLVLHAGDLFYPSVMSKYLQAQPIVRIMNALDGDPAAFDPNLIATFGNHEFDNSDPGILLGRTAQADFDWVSSNVNYRSTATGPGETLSKRLRNVHETLVRDMDGAKIGIFGLTIDATDRDYVSYAYADWESRKALVRRMIDQLQQQGAQLILALTHQDLPEDERLAKAFPEIDLIVGGHEHFHIQRRLGKTWITKADSDIQSAVVYDVSFQGDGRLDARPRRIVLGADTPQDPDIQAVVDRYQEQLQNELRKTVTGFDGGEVVGQTVHLLEGVETAVRGKETALGNFLADVIRQRMKTDVAFLNGGGIRINDNILPGPITRMDLEGIFYFDNHLVAFEVTGAELLDILRNSVSRTHLGDGRFLQVSGIRFRFHRMGLDDSPKFVVNAEDVEILQRGGLGYKPLDPARRYTVGTSDFIWQSGYKDGYRLFAKGEGKTSPELLDRGKEPISFRKLVEKAIQELPKKTVTTGIEGRIVELAH